MDIIESGRVVAVEETGVWVETIRSSACGSCAARSGCGHRTLAGVLTSDKGLVRARESDQLKAAAKKEARETAIAAIKAVVEAGGRSVDEKVQSLQEMKATGALDPVAGAFQSHLVLKEAIEKLAG